MKKLYSAAFALLLFFLGPIYSVRADTDGFYCATRDYIAYDLRSFKTPGLSAPHVLRIVRFGDGIRQSGEVAMQDFQASEFRCDARQIEIAGYDRNWLKYVIDASQPNTLRIIQIFEEPIQQHSLGRDITGPSIFRYPARHGST